MQIVIKKGTIRSSLFLTYKFERSDVGVKETITANSDAAIHEDLRKAFRKLIPHYAFICEEITNKSLVKKAIQDPDLYLTDRESAPDDSFFTYRVYEFELKESKGYETLHISGAKQLSSHEEISFSTPPIDLLDSEYPFQKELETAIEELKEEVLAYMQGKAAPKAQMGMFPEGEDGVSPEEE